MSSVNNNRLIFFFSNQDAFPFSCLNAVVKTLNTTMNGRSVESEHSFLAPHLKNHSVCHR